MKDLELGCGATAGPQSPPRAHGKRSVTSELAPQILEGKGLGDQDCDTITNTMKYTYVAGDRA